jgi:hypothetical protein
MVRRATLETTSLRSGVIVQSTPIAINRSTPLASEYPGRDPVHRSSSPFNARRLGKSTSQRVGIDDG